MIKKQILKINHLIIRSYLVGVVSVFSVSQVGAVLPAQIDGQPLPSLAPILEQVTPSVVNIYTETRVQVQSRSPFLNDPFFRHFFEMRSVPRERVSRSLGSGVIVDAERGYILTNHHVINDADDIAVTLNDGRSYTAELVGSDEATDVAVIQINADSDPLQALGLNLDNNMRVGDFVVAVGNPFGLGQTVTSGIVSALGRTALNRLALQNFIQTDASINPGNSGGALIDLNGDLVGINTAIFTPSGGNVGIGFAIPINMAKLVMQQLIQYGEVRRGILGLETQDLDNELAAGLNLDINRGAVITRVLPGTPAEEAGLEVGDVIVAANDEPISNSQMLNNAEGLTPLGESIDLDILRNGKSRSIRAVTALPPNRHVPGEQLHPKLDGIVLDALPERSRLNGALVESIDKNSNAYATGMRQGDVITAINRVRFRDVERLRDLLNEISDRDELLLQIQRGRRAYLVPLE